MTAPSNVKPPADEVAGRAAHGLSVPSVEPRNDFVPFPPEDVEGAIFERFERQVAIHAGRLAVKDGATEVTYEELNRSANRLAHAILAKRGDESEPVLVVLETGLPAIVGILGTLKAGKFYVPLDPALPPERIRYVLEDSQADLVVTSEGNVSSLRELTGDARPMINLDDLPPGLPEGNPGLSVPPDAYLAILYTSGSTGRPKGVINTHRNELHGRMMAINDAHFCAEDRGTLLSSLSFGAAQPSVFDPLLTGGAVLPFNVPRRGLGALAEWLIEEQITVYRSVASLFRDFAGTLTGREEFPKVRLVSLGGETIRMRDVELYRRHFPADCLLRVSMKCTEGSGTGTRMFLDKQSELMDDRVPAGYASEDAEILVLDEERNELGPGQVGEIAFRSRYLSPGYWRKPELTAERFLPDPDGGDARTYLTGDLGYRTPEGCFYHVGRKDFQVKIRGYRIETASVEKAVLQHPHVRDAAVVAHDDGRGGRELVAYLVPSDPAHTPAVGEMRRFLGGKLPHFMVPTLFVSLESLPKTPTGKLDRNALPAPDRRPPATEAASVEPRDMMERQLAQIWQKVLDVPRLGVKDDFFDLGGHSLLAARLVADIATAFGKALPPATLFESPTVEELARVLEGEGWATSLSPIVGLETGGDGPPFFCVAAQDAFAYVDLSRCLGADQPLYVLHPLGFIGPDNPAPDVPTLAARYVGEIRKVQADGPYLVGGMCAGGVVAFEVAQQLVRQGQEVALLALIDTPYASIPRARRVNALLRRWPARVARRIVHHVRTFWRLKFREKLPYILGRLKTAKRLAIEGPPPASQAAEDAIVEHYWTPIRAAYRESLPRYVPQPYPGRVVLFLGSGTPWGPLFDPRLGWRKVAAGGVDLHVVPGDHTNALREPHVPVLAEKLGEYIMAVRDAASK